MPCGLSHCQLLGYFAASVSLAPALLAVLWLQLLDLWSDPTYSGPNGESGALSGLTGSCSGPDAIKLDVSWCRVCPSVLLPGHHQQQHQQVLVHHQQRPIFNFAGFGDNLKKSHHEKKLLG